MQRLCLLLLAAVIAVGTPALALVSAKPRQTTFLLVVAGPARIDEIVAAAGGVEVGPARAPLARVVASGQGPGDADLARRLRQAGAWAVLDGTVGAILCGV